MKYSAETRVNIDLLNDTNFKIEDEVFFRKLAIKMVSEMPLDDLNKLFNFNKIKPIIPEDISKLYPRLREESEVIYSAKVYVPNN